MYLFVVKGVNIGRDIVKNSGIFLGHLALLQQKYSKIPISTFFLGFFQQCQPILLCFCQSISLGIETFVHCYYKQCKTTYIREGPAKTKQR